mmetsp:Transcript_21715/g.55449  ORF Transcript_21715/g.55449 Transcript_21715/m.55449 type:complete len:235 (+) Transcript_21715:140-844(+)
MPMMRLRPFSSRTLCSPHRLVEARQLWVAECWIHLGARSMVALRSRAYQSQSSPLRPSSQKSGPYRGISTWVRRPSTPSRPLAAANRCFCLERRAPASLALRGMPYSPSASLTCIASSLYPVAVPWGRRTNWRPCAFKGTIPPAARWWQPSRRTHPPRNACFAWQQRVRWPRLCAIRAATPSSLRMTSAACATSGTSQAKQSQLRAGHEVLPPTTCTLRSSESSTLACFSERRR